jgi:hypothetical protein
MQDEHETGKNGVGVARLGASADVECREPEPGTDPGVSQNATDALRFFQSRLSCVSEPRPKGAVFWGCFNISMPRQASNNDHRSRSARIIFAGGIRGRNGVKT